MITCLKHKVDFVDGECPRCKFPELYYSSDEPVHKSDYIQSLDEINKKIEEINARALKLLEDNKEI